MKTNLKKSLMATAAAGVLALGMASDAEADVVAFGSMIITDAFLLVNDGTASGFVPGDFGPPVVLPVDPDTVYSLDQLDGVDLTGASLLNDVGADANLTGFAPVSDSTTPAFGPAGVPVQCVGSCSATNDLFSQDPIGPTFARGDADIGNLGGTSLIGDPTNNLGFGSIPKATGVALGDVVHLGPPSPAGVDLGAQARVVSDVQLVGTAAGVANGVTGNTSTATFTTGSGGAPDGLVFQFNAVIDLLADMTTATDFPGQKAVVTPQYTISLTTPDGFGGVTTLATWAPDGVISEAGEMADPFSLNDIIQTGTVGTKDELSTSGSFAFLLPALAANTEFTLQITQSMKADAVAIPEPASLALLGAGLAGLGLARRRQRRKAA